MSSNSVGRPGAQYSRRRIVRACLICRSRKSRCDGARPQCSFCIQSGSTCKYPETESARLDVGSIQILERIGSAEASILQALEQISPNFRRTRGTVEQSRSIQHSRQAEQDAGLLWMNGDVLMTWSSLLPLLYDHNKASPLQAFAEELRAYSPRFSLAPQVFPTSPTVLATLQVSPDIGAGDPMQVSGTENASSIQELEEAQTSLSSDHEAIWAWIKSYLISMHSKSPILDLDWLESMSDSAVLNAIDFTRAARDGLPPNTEPAGVAILLLVIALGQITSSAPSAHQLPTSGYVTLALPWLGLAVFSAGESIQVFQAQLLLCSYYMWTMRHWEAWSLADFTALNAEKVLTRNPKIVTNNLNHRVLWAVAKMQLELMEECQIHYPHYRQGRLYELIMSTSLPKPPTEAFKWLQVDSSFQQDTWYYYLAETSSRKLVERIKIELYSGCGGAEQKEWLSSQLPLASELERQVEEWMDSLPDDFQSEHTESDTGPFLDMVMSPNSIHGTRRAKLGMRTVLRNRMWQLQMLIYRPFLASVGDYEGATPPEAILKGGAKCLTYAVTFLTEQPPAVVRHYGSWLLARNAWTAGLSCIAALNEPFMRKYTSGTESGGISMFEDCHLSATPTSGTGNQGIPDDSDLLEAVRRACSILRQWSYESQSLATCEWILSHMLRKTAPTALPP
ncbi:hypothetical protein VTL71DRAFT_15778 [Oculimacula yallundae]|uniref:Zn(2)-C6 fungal-type domain-containing protein n=1 Tax=Oculimacula yallundae TaxID=86028 RepID=A0ABR4CDU5_9HELO